MAAVPKGGCIPISTPTTVNVVWLPPVDWECSSHEGIMFCAPTVATPATGLELVGNEITLPLVSIPYCKVRGEAITVHPEYGVVRTIGFGLATFVDPGNSTLLVSYRNPAQKGGGKWVHTVGEAPVPEDFPPGLGGILDFGFPVSRGLKDEMNIDISPEEIREHMSLTGFAAYSPGGLVFGLRVNLGDLGYTTGSVFAAQRDAEDRWENQMFAFDCGTPNALDVLRPWDDMGRYITETALFAQSGAHSTP